MPVCTQCGGTEFNEDCGYFYCVVCHVQSQDIRVEENEFQDVQKIAISRLPKETKSKKEKEEAKRKNLGRPWTTYEGYECVIKQQVKKLIEMGADEKLDEIVFRCWTAYIRASEIAFCENEHLVAPGVKNAARQRNINCGSLDNPVVKCKWSRKNAAPSQKDINQLELTRELANEEFYDADNPTLEDGYIKTRKKEKADPYLMNSRLQMVRKQVEWMTLAQTLSFLYVGLLFTNNHVTPSELLSLAESDQIPFYSAHKCLKEDMKLSSLDSLLFRTNLPTTLSLRENTSKLLRFLNIYDIPPLDIHIVLNKLMQRLDLPVELVAVVRNVIDMKPLDMSVNADTYVKDVELIASCYIIITLKLFFGINDSTEHILTHSARKLSKILPNSSLFIWEDWQLHMSSKYRVKEKVVNHISRSTEKETNVSQFVERYCATAKLGNEVVVSKRKRNKQKDSVIPNVVEFVKRMKMSKMTEEVTKSGDDVGQESASQVNDGTKFRGSSIKYLATQDVMEIVKDLRVSSDDGSSSKRARKNNGEDSEGKRKKNLDSDILLDGIDQISPKGRRKAEKILLTIQNQIGEYTQYKASHSVLSEMALKNIYKFRRHVSYEWLMSLFCKLIRCRIDRLERALFSIETILFTTKKSIPGNMNVFYRCHYKTEEVLLTS